MFNSPLPFPRGLSAHRTSPHTFCTSLSYPFSFLPHSWVRRLGEGGVEKWTFYSKNISILSLSSEWWSVKLQLCCSSGIRRNQTSQWLLIAVLMYKIYQRHSFSKLRCPEGSINREFKQIATAGADTAAGSKFPQNVILRMCVGCIQP